MAITEALTTALWEFVYRALCFLYFLWSLHFTGMSSMLIVTRLRLHGITMVVPWLNHVVVPWYKYGSRTMVEQCFIYKVVPWQIVVPSSSFVRRHQEPLRRSSTTAPDSVSPHIGWWQLAVVPNLVQPAFWRTTGTTFPWCVWETAERQVNLAA